MVIDPEAHTKELKETEDSGKDSIQPNIRAAMDSHSMYPAAFNCLLLLFAQPTAPEGHVPALQRRAWRSYRRSASPSQRASSR
eukprot:7302189-Prymnesium_polylepis.1